MDGYELGQRIADLRKGEGESQEQLAASLGEVRETVKHWENGTRQLKAEAIVKLASHFNVSSDYLLGLREGKSTDITIQGVVDFTGLSEEAVEKLHFAMSGFRAKSFSEYINRFIGSEYFLLLISNLFELKEAVEADQKNGTGKSRSENTVTLEGLEEVNEQFRVRNDLNRDINFMKFLAHDALDRILKEICKDEFEYLDRLEKEIHALVAFADKHGVDLRREYDAEK